MLFCGDACMKAEDEHRKMLERVAEEARLEAKNKEPTWVAELQDQRAQIQALEIDLKASRDGRDFWYNRDFECNRLLDEKTIQNNYIMKLNLIYCALLVISGVAWVGYLIDWLIS